MGCNCGGTKTQAQQFLYVSPKGEAKVYPTEVQARAAQIRNGGGSITVQAK
jgi:t-SNARE complex subunit (syntaxin)